MVPRLTKCRKDGRRYERRPEIEGKIEIALDQSLSVLLDRTTISDSKATDYLPSEVLVHLIRTARRNGDEIKMNNLLARLFIRSERIVRNELRRQFFENRDTIVDDVLEELGELFAIDETEQDKKHKLDFYECAFRKALLALCTNAVNKHLKEARIVSLAPDTDEGESPKHKELVAQIAELRSPETSVDDETLEKLRNAVATLSKDERDAITLVYFQEYEVESEDKTKRTAATICGVTGRTIFNRLARATKKLAQIMEES